MTSSPPSPRSQALREMEGETETKRKTKRERARGRESKLQCEPRGQKETEGAIEGEDS